MALYRSQFHLLARICRASILALILTIGSLGLPANVAAQQPAAKKAAPAASAASAGPKNPWVKICEKTPVGTMYKDGKEEKRYSNYCLTQHERIDGNSGLAVMSAALRQMDGEAKQFLMVMVPLGVKLQAGIRAALYPKDLWEPAQKNEKIDETKLKGVQLDYTLCHVAGCTAQVEATPELINDLKTFGGIAFFSVNGAGEVTSFPVPLAGFERAYAGSGVEAAQYVAGRRALQEQLAQRRRELAEKQKQQPQAAPGAAATAPKK